jgi:serine-type D-Ala-D-Ala carboxypeptidase (penicillin-binding protein 5/6)
MQAWKRGDKEYTLITLNSRRLGQRRPNPLQLKMLPALNKIVAVEPINFIHYERNKKSRKLALEKPPLEANLFLEGEYCSATPYHLRPSKPRHKPVDYSTMPNLERRTINQTSHDLGSLKPDHSRTMNKEETLQLHLSESKSNPPAPLRRKIINNLSTVTRRQREEPKVRSNKSLALIKSTENLGERQKQLFFLEKKQLERVRTESFIVMEHPSLKILTGNRFRNVAEVASLTKIMTFYTAYQLAQQHLIDIATELVTVDEAASSMTGTSAELAVGDILTVEQLFYGLMLPSGNDAALVLATWAGSLDASPEESAPGDVFLGLMNRFARELELRNSNFANPHGLPNFRNTSTPYDLALLTSACLQIPLFCRVVSTQLHRTWVRNEGGKKEMVWENTNKLLRREGFIGAKTGVTVTAGPCLATCYEAGEKKFIVVLLRTNKLSRRFKETRMILGWTLRKYDREAYGEAARRMLKNDVVFDSDNSEDEDEFIYDRLDAQELAKRNKILECEL